MSSDPWSSIHPPQDPENLTARRSDPDHPWNFFWGRDVRKRYLFIMEFSPDGRPLRDLPRLQGLDITERIASVEERHQLVVALRDSANRDLFFRLCTDLLDATRPSPDERSAVGTAVTRLWRWQQLLRRARLDKLTVAEQKGLVGELTFLRDYLLSHFQPSSAIAFWQGPMRGEGQKDFSVNERAVEVKARSGTARSRVRISSEEQLDPGGYDALFLAVFEVSAAGREQHGRFNLHDLVGGIRSHIMEHAPAAADLFEERLAATGYCDDDDYADDLFVILSSSFYKVAEGFPRIVRADVPQGVTDVAYSVDLMACSTFTIGGQNLVGMLTEQSHDD